MARHKSESREQILGETRKSLLDAAAEEIAHEGYSGANINRISEAAGFAKGTIYNYFPSKRALMLALIEEVGSKHVQLLVEAVRREADPAHRLERLFEAGFAFVIDHPTQARVMFITLNGADAEFKQAMYHVYQPVFEVIGTEIIAAGIAKGTFRQVDPVATSSLLMTIYLGTASQLDEKGRPWMQPAEIADFVLHALHSS